jgi:hypothetical protein
MKSYLVETQDDSAPVKYKVLLKKNVYKLHYFHIIVTSSSMVIASTNPAICKAYPNQDILDYYQSNSLETLRAFGFGKYQYVPYSKVIENDPTYVQWCLNNIPDFSLYSYEMEALQVKLDKLKLTLRFFK